MNRYTYPVLEKRYKEAREERNKGITRRKKDDSRV